VPRHGAKRIGSRDGAATRSVVIDAVVASPGAAGLREREHPPEPGLHAGGPAPVRPVPGRVVVISSVGTSVLMRRRRSVSRLV
jgi:hypothetical protein